MCEPVKTLGFFARQVACARGDAELRRQEREAAQAAPCDGSCRRRLTATQKGQRFLAGVGVVVLLACMNVVLHVLAVLLMLAGALAVAVPVARWALRRRQEASARQAAELARVAEILARAPGRRTIAAQVAPSITSDRSRPAAAIRRRNGASSGR